MSMVECQLMKLEYEQLRNVALQNILRAAENPLTYARYRQMDNEDREMARTRVLDRERHTRELQEVLRDPSFVITNNPHEFFSYIALLSQRYYLVGVAEHEWDHFRVAREEGFDPSLVFYFVGVSRSVPLFVQPSVLLGEIPDGMSDEQFFSAVDRITVAPQRLSKPDKMWLNAAPGAGLKDR